MGWWDVSGLENGPHTLRLLVYDTRGAPYETRMRVFVENQPPTSEPALTPTWTPEPIPPTATWTPEPIPPTATFTPEPTWTPEPAPPGLLRTAALNATLQRGLDNPMDAAIAEAARAAGIDLGEARALDEQPYDFDRKRLSVLVATDVAARGIHVDNVPLIIQADAPDEYKTYLHRAGRTGRAGARGTVVTLIGRRGKPRMEELLERAEIVAETSDVAPGDALLRELAAR